MNRWRRIFPLLLSLLLAAACSGNPGEHAAHHGGQANQEKAVPSSGTLTITFAASPERPAPGATVTLTSEVKREGQPVDAEVEFEIWKSGGNHERLKAARKAAGVYSAGKSGLQPGEYSVIVHVNAPGIHQMTAGGFNVSGGEAHDHGHGHGAVLHIQVPDTVRTGSKTSLTAHVQVSGKPLSGASVRFEYWTESGKHEYVEAAEVKPGEYAAHAVFPRPGRWSLKLHVEKGTLHEHEEITMNVQ